MAADTNTTTRVRRNRNRLSVSPNVVAGRRGGHLPARRERTETTSTTPEFHIGPNVVGSARGGSHPYSLSGLVKARRADRPVRL